MNIYDLAPVQALLSAASWAVGQLSILVQPLVGEGASAAVAVVLLTLLVRTALIPVGISQARAARTRRRLAPRLAELQRRHRRQPEILQRKVAELYASEKASPLQGCLPVLAQAPILLAVYGIFVHPRIGGAPNELLAHAVFGVGLGDSLVGGIVAGTASAASIAVFAVLIAVIAVVAQLSRRLQPVELPVGGAAAPGAEGLVRVVSLLPFATAAIAAFVPLAAALYLAVTTAWTLGERLVLRRLLGA
ncbi:membrane protein insertase YidC [Microbacterium paludicola]|uniref:Membrane protein insertase YidC n=1 Tax=Microbacterium paludicola TaxID=300019 RepID=A0A4Y9FY22_9MICO|nr:membrane protein insertase YidC [Microbacterium paludicola]MBF0816135.1 membrane protein insertase YidC [Microbacterium paludicola]TFU33196.1 membrane protein insertase YidC [Microbacterium paludicola]